MHALKESVFMRIVVFSPDVPYPANRGGRADIWRRIMAFVRLGFPVMLVNLYEPSGPLSPRAEDLDVVDDVVSHRFSFPIRRSGGRTLIQLVNCWRLPWHAATRVPNESDELEMRKVLDDFDPTHIWLDGPWFGVTALKVSRERNLPLLYRSHNVEHVYLPRQAASAVRYRDRVAWRIASFGLKAWEFSLIRQANFVFDISMDDLDFWRSQGVKNIKWLPPLPELSFRSVPERKIHGDVVFVGNLGTPNNVRGVEWLVNEVFPIVLSEFPSARLLVVGSNPTRHISSLCQDKVSVELVGGVPDTLPYLFGAKVLVNPVRSGSGVQVKMLDMLMTDAPIVTSTQGTRGLPSELKNLLNVADSAEDFAALICRELACSSVDMSARSRARRFFTVAGFGEIVSSALIGSEL